jgi:hypothetical protein
VRKNILNLIYPKQEIFIRDFGFPSRGLVIVTTCSVPLKSKYVLKPVPYVTAENYVRCLSQASYLLAHQIIKNKRIALDITEEAFVNAAVNYELYYRNLAMTFHRRVGKDEEFIMKLILENFREIRRFEDFILFTFSNERTVISGEMSFIFKK